MSYIIGSAITFFLIVILVTIALYFLLYGSNILIFSELDIEEEPDCYCLECGETITPEQMEETGLCRGCWVEALPCDEEFDLENEAVHD